MALYGCEVPRVWTPPLRELTRDTTLGYDAIDFAQDVLCLTLYPWQKWLFVHALEIEGSLETRWRFRFRMVVVLVGRQNGKTTLGAILSLFFLYALGVALIIGTAQDLEQAEDTWSACVEMAEADPLLASEISHVWHTNGAKRLALKGGRDYRVRAATRKAGRGKSADLVLLDELREHQTWAAYAALSKTGMARESSLLWCMSNAGDATSVVLRHFRAKAHALLGDPDGINKDNEDSAPDSDDLDAEGSTLAIFEWSAAPDADKRDTDAWRQANPSLGYGITERALRSACSDDPDEVFRTECLCQWVGKAVEPPFPAGSWEAGIDPTSRIAPDSPLSFGLDVSADRRHASIAVCGLRADRTWHVEVVARETGTQWIVEWFRKRAGTPRYGTMRVAMQKNGAPVSPYADVLSAIDHVEVVPLYGSALSGACGGFWDGVAALEPHATEPPDAVPIHHVPQPALDLAAAIATAKPMGDGGFLWNRRASAEDISTLFACTMAHGLANTKKDAPRESAYEHEDLLIL